MQSSSKSLRLAASAAHIGAVVSAFGVVFLVLLYIGLFADVPALLVFGPLNDLCVLIQYLLATPLAVVFHRVLRPHSPARSVGALTVGLLGMAGAVVFQALLLLGVLPFREQLPFAAASVLLAGVWVIIVGLWSRRIGFWHGSATRVVLAGLYVGYPIWVYSVGQQFRAHSLASEPVAA